GLGDFVRAGGEDAVHVGPDDEFFGVHDVGDEGAGEIGAVATERGDTAVEGRTDETGNDRHDARFEQWHKSFAAALSGMPEMGFRVLESVAGQNEVRGSHGNRDDAELV